MAWSDGNERSPEAGCVMIHAQFRKRLERLERPFQSPKIVEVCLIGEGEPEPLQDPGVKVIRITLGTPFEKADEAR